MESVDALQDVVRRSGLTGDYEKLTKLVLDLEAREAEYLRAFERIAHGSYTDPETPRAIARTFLPRPQ